MRLRARLATLSVLALAGCQITVTPNTGGPAFPSTPDVPPSKVLRTERPLTPPPTSFPVSTIAPTSPRPSTRPIPGSPSATATRRPTPGPNDTPDWNATPTPRVVASAPAPGPGMKTVIISGMVYDDNGAVIDAAIVSVSSLDASVPYRAVATTSEGAWVVNNVPEGVNIEIVATRDGWTLRRRVGSFQTSTTTKNLVYFGRTPAEAPPNSGAGDAYFLSRRPEIVRTDPFDRSSQILPDDLHVKLTLSEPLDAANRARFAKALRLWPASKAAGASAPTDLADLRDKDLGDGLAGLGLDFSVTPLPAAIGVAFGEGSQMGDNPPLPVGVAWNAEGQEATLVLPGRLNSRNDFGEARYQLGLVSDGRVIADAEGLGLGTDHAGRHDSAPPAGQLWANVFREVDLALPFAANGHDAASRWAGTHDATVVFTTK